MKGYALLVKAISVVTRMKMEWEWKGKRIWKPPESHTIMLLISTIPTTVTD